MSCSREDSSLWPGHTLRSNRQCRLFFSDLENIILLHRYLKVKLLLGSVKKKHSSHFPYSGLIILERFSKCKKISLEVLILVMDNVISGDGDILIVSNLRLTSH